MIGSDLPVAALFEIGRIRRETNPVDKDGNHGVTDAGLNPQDPGFPQPDTLKDVKEVSCRRLWKISTLRQAIQRKDESSKQRNAKIMLSALSENADWLPEMIEGMTHLPEFWFQIDKWILLVKFKREIRRKCANTIRSLRLGD